MKLHVVPDTLVPEAEGAKRGGDDEAFWSRWSFGKQVPFAFSDATDLCRDLGEILLSQRLSTSKEERSHLERAFKFFRSTCTF